MYVVVVVAFCSISVPTFHSVDKWNTSIWFCDVYLTFLLPAIFDFFGFRSSTQFLNWIIGENKLTSQKKYYTCILTLYKSTILVCFAFKENFHSSRSSLFLMNELIKLNVVWWSAHTTQFELFSCLASLLLALIQRKRTKKYFYARFWSDTWGICGADNIVLFREPYLAAICGRTQAVLLSTFADTRSTRATQSEQRPCQTAKYRKDRFQISFR
jgi:hypothetical protein